MDIPPELQDHPLIELVLPVEQVELLLLEPQPIVVLVGVVVILTAPLEVQVEEALVQAGAIVQVGAVVLEEAIAQVEVVPEALVEVIEVRVEAHPDLPAEEDLPVVVDPLVEEDLLEVGATNQFSTY